MTLLDYWILFVGLAMWFGSVFLGWKSRRDHDRAVLEFLARGIHPSMWSRGCFCGEPDRGEPAHHRTDGPCYWETVDGS